MLTCIRLLHKASIGLISVSFIFYCGSLASVFGGSCSTPTFSIDPIFTTSDFQSVAVADFDRDGQLDAAIASTRDVTILIGSGTGRFRSQKQFAAGLFPFSVAVGDFNSDNILDLAVANYTSNDVSILIGDGQGNFGEAISFPVGTTPVYVIVGDFNGDRKPDLAVANLLSATISILLGDGIGGFGRAAHITTGTYPSSIATGDFNSDNRLDLAVTNYGAGNVGILLGDGRGEFRLSLSLSTGTGPFSISAGDLNGDGKIDLAVANLPDDSVSVLMGDGAGRFSMATSFMVATKPLSIITADFNGDRKADLAVASSSESPNNIIVLSGDGTGTFRTEATLSQSQPRSLNFGDFNDDGKVDLIVANGISNSSALLPSGSVSLFLGKPEQGFARVVTTFTPTNPSGVFRMRSFGVGDFDGDDRLDLVVAGSTARQIPDFIPEEGSILLFSGDGTGGFGTAATLIVSPATSTTSTSFSLAVPGDFNTDGNLDLATVSTVGVTSFPPRPPTSSISIYLGDGQGNFNIAANIAIGIGLSLSDLSVGDINSDGNPDVIATTSDQATGAGSVLFYPGNGRGGLGARTAPISTARFRGFVPFKITTGDFNGDGKLDLVVLTMSSFFGPGPLPPSPPVILFLGDGNATFEESRDIALEPGVTLRDISPEHFNDDGHLDLVAAATRRNFTFTQTATISVYLGDGRGGFGTPHQTVLGNDFLVSIAIGDLNNDGQPDLIGQTFSSDFLSRNTLTLFFNLCIASDARSFVRQHYRDFLNREPDVSGLAFWSNEITACGGDVECSARKRINVSAAFFHSIEFQQTGYFVYRMYKAAYGNVAATPVPVRFNEFLPDTQQIGLGVVVGPQTGWEQVLENNKIGFVAEFVARPRFTTAYPTTWTPPQFVDALLSNAAVQPSETDRQWIMDEFWGAPNTIDTAARARALRRVAEHSLLKQQEFNRAFVLMQYFGYLRRNPNDSPDADYAGYNFWLGKLNQFNGNFIDAEMVKAFITSGEYQQRFGP